MPWIRYALMIHEVRFIQESNPNSQISLLSLQFFEQILHFKLEVVGR